MRRFALPRGRRRPPLARAGRRLRCLDGRAGAAAQGAVTTGGAGLPTRAVPRGAPEREASLKEGERLAVGGRALLPRAGSRTPSGRLPRMRSCCRGDASPARRRRVPARGRPGLLRDGDAAEATLAGPARAARRVAARVGRSPSARRRAAPRSAALQVHRSGPAAGDPAARSRGARCAGRSRARGGSTSTRHGASRPRSTRSPSPASCAS